MICVSVMLAIFLAWPIVFGGDTAAVQQTVQQPSTRQAVLQAVSGAAKASTVASVVPANVAPAVVESCLRRYQREDALCTAAQGQACRQRAADAWNLCEARGVWPE